MTEATQAAPACPVCGHGCPSGPCDDCARFDGRGWSGEAGTMLRLSRAPVRNTLALACDPRYGGHGAFMLNGTGVAVLTAALVSRSKASFPADMAAADIEVAHAVSELAGLMVTFAFYGFVFIGYWAGFLIYRRFAGRTRTRAEYYKVTCLAVGFIGLFTALANGLHYFSPAMNETASAAATAGWITILAAKLGLMAFCAYYFIRVQIAFWGLSAAGAAVAIPLVAAVSALLLPLAALLVGAVVAMILAAMFFVGGGLPA